MKNMRNLIKLAMKYIRQLDQISHEKHQEFSHGKDPGILIMKKYEEFDQI